MGKATKNGFVEYRHIHLPVGNLPSVTIKFDVNQTNAEVTCSFAICSPADNFSREVGRTISDERMNNGQVVRFMYNRDLSLTNNVMSYLYDIMEERVEPPEEIEVRELARAYYYINHVLTVKDYIEQFGNHVSEEEESMLILPNTNIIGA